jgi:hypothetical protein
MNSTQMHDFIMRKLPILRETDVSANDLKNIFDILDKMELDILEEIVIKFLKKSHPSAILSFTKFM